MKRKKRIKFLAAGLAALLMCCSLAGCYGLIDLEPRIEAVGTSQGMYSYETLTEEEKAVYDEITYCIEQRLESIELSTVDTDILEKAYWAVYYDHCEYFWTTSYQYETYTNRKNEPVKLVFRPIYTMTEEEQASYQEKIDIAVADILKGISMDASDYQKALYVYTVLIEQTDYNLDAENNQSIISTFLNQETVCRGYAYGAQYLLNQLGVFCISVCGVSEGENHSWNLIQMDGKYYYMDATWGEVSYWQEVDEESTEEEVTLVEADMVNYCYFGVSDDDLAFKEGHQVFDYVPMPECTAVENNYFVKEGLYFDGENTSEAGAKIREAYDAREAGVLLKFDTIEDYDEAFDYLVNKGHWSDYCDSNKISYVDHFEENVLLFEFYRE